MSTPAVTPITTREELKAFLKQHPTASKVLGRVFAKCRIARSTRPGVPGYWAAYPYREWSEDTGLSEATLKRQFNLLYDNGLIERDLGRHSGTRVITFIRPSELAKSLSGSSKDVKAVPSPPVTTSYKKSKPAPVSATILPIPKKPEEPKATWADISKAMMGSSKEDKASPASATIVASTPKKSKPKAMTKEEMQAILFGD